MASLTLKNVKKIYPHSEDTKKSKKKKKGEEVEKKTNLQITDKGVDILPTDIVTYEKDTLELLDDLNTSNQKLIKMTFLITCYGRTKRDTF